MMATTTQPQHPQLMPRATACGVETGSNTEGEGMGATMTEMTVLAANDEGQWDGEP
jgi:hypothetical protein